MDDVRARLASLERSLLLYRFSLIILISVLLITPTLSSVMAQGDVLRVRQLDLIDGAGRVRAQLGITCWDEAFLLVRSADGKFNAMMASGNDDPTRPARSNPTGRGPMGDHAMITTWMRGQETEPSPTASARIDYSLSCGAKSANSVTLVGGIRPISILETYFLGYNSPTTQGSRLIITGPAGQTIQER